MFVQRSLRCCLLAVFVAAVSTSVASASGGAIIDNGVVQLGVHAEGHLNVPGGSASSGSGTTAVGLRFKLTNADATAPGCLCEGWGVADPATETAGWANEHEGGARNLEVVSFESTASTARSVVRVPGMFEVTHDYHPSPYTPNLYEVVVGIKNIGAEAVSPTYRRVMDWDVEPTAFSEYVTTVTGESQGSRPTALLDNDNDGFAPANPLARDGNLGQSGEFTDVGPTDHGARFDFGFSELAPGVEVRFRIFYGAAADEVTALGALSIVGSEVYSLGQPSTANGKSEGEPNTFMFAFAGVGGAPAVDTVALPAGTYGRWPTRTDGPTTVYYSYAGGHRYLGNMHQAAENWSNAGSALRIARHPGVPFANHLSVYDTWTDADWFGYAPAGGGCRPGESKCVFSRNALYFNPRLLDPKDDAFRTFTATHELGHSIGFCHQSPSSKATSASGDCGLKIPASTPSVMHAGPVILAGGDPKYNVPQKHDVDLLKELYP